MLGLAMQKRIASMLGMTPPNNTMVTRLAFRHLAHKVPQKVKNVY